MELQRCEMCGKRFKRLHDHHVIPWRFSHDDSESNIVKVCASCHNKADANFTSLIIYGEMSDSEGIHKRVLRRYGKKYRRIKTLYLVTLLKRTYYQDSLVYNIRTGHINISQSWYYIRRRPKEHIGSSVNIRKRLKKVASAKGQTALSGN